MHRITPTIALTLLFATATPGSAQRPVFPFLNSDPIDPAELPMTTDERAKALIEYYEMHVRPVEIEANFAWWDANLSGAESDFDRKINVENQLNGILASEFRFEQIKALREEGVQDPLLTRQLDLLYLKYLPKQVNAELLQRITAKSNAIEQAFNVYRAVVGERQLSDSEVRVILRQSRDSEERHRVWEASKAVARSVENDVKELVVLRNKAARKLGFDNYHAMQLTLAEQSPQDILQLFDELDLLTREPFAKAKAEIDAVLAEQYGIAVDELRPWHYHDPFFQEPPDVLDANFDQLFASVDIPRICAKFYAGIGLPIQDVIDHSDLYEKPGKNPHAFCTDLDREGDVRVLANIVPNEYWMGTMLHEFGHAVYSSNTIPESLPYLLRTDAHILTTEGMAMMFERFVGSADWLRAMGIQVSDPAAYTAMSRVKRRYKLLVFSRWCQVMFRFEQQMYRDPTQDLNLLWWELVEEYQQLQRPDGRNEPDYASKIHIVSAPAYYHNYLLGEMFACQLHAAVTDQVLELRDPTRAVYHDNRDVGRFLKDRVFAKGASLPWQSLVEQATGEPLNAAAFAREFSE